MKVYNINATPTGVESEEVVYARTCFNREVDILQQLSHPHIIALEDSVLREDVPYVVLERMSCTLMEVSCLVTCVLSQLHDVCMHWLWSNCEC